MHLSAELDQYETLPRSPATPVRVAARVLSIERANARARAGGADERRLEHLCFVSSPIRSFRAFVFRAFGTRSCQVRFGRETVLTTRVVRGYSKQSRSSSPDTVSTTLKKNQQEYQKPTNVG